MCTTSLYLNRFLYNRFTLLGSYMHALTWKDDVSLGVCCVLCFVASGGSNKQQN